MPGLRTFTATAVLMSGAVAAPPGAWPPAAPAAAAASVPPASLVSAPVRAAPPLPALAWRPCAQVTNGWERDIEDTRAECAQLRVPLDYDEPRGRSTTIAVSRLRATGAAQPRGVIAVSPGGPGLFNLDAPVSFSRSELGELSQDHDLVGLDPRGTGHSAKLECKEGPYPELPPDATERQRDAAAFRYQSEFNRRCTARDPEFVASLTPENVARDLDRLRAALGEDRISFYGVSFGTAIGTAYRTLFGDRVHRMWLDSPMPPVFDHAAMDQDLEELREVAFAEFTEWLAARDAEFHLGASPAEVRTTLLDLRDELTRDPRTVDGVVLDRQWVLDRLPGGASSDADELAIAVEGGSFGAAPEPSRGAAGPPVRILGLADPRGGINAIQYNAMLCNSATGPTDFASMWRAKQSRRSVLPATGGYQLSVWCADWPLPVQRLPQRRGESALQISGHLDESITPYAWAQSLRRATGGRLLTVLDDRHGSLGQLPCAARAVQFFRYGTPASGTCPGIV